MHEFVQILLLTSFVTSFRDLKEFKFLQNPKYNETCSSHDLAEVCENDCVDQFSECSHKCSDEACITSCKRSGFICMES